MASTQRMKSAMNVTTCRWRVARPTVNFSRTRTARRQAIVSSYRWKSTHVSLQSAGSCCQASCQFQPVGYECHAETECRLAIQCSGASARCPDRDRQYFKADRTRCADGARLCRNGSCSLSVCALHALLPCQIEQPEQERCRVACRQPDGTCVRFQSVHSDGSSSTTPYLPCTTAFHRRARFETSTSFVL
jgi:hypothetical protein